MKKTILYLLFCTLCFATGPEIVGNPDSPYSFLYFSRLKQIDEFLKSLNLDKKDIDEFLESLNLDKKDIDEFLESLNLDKKDITDKSDTSSSKKPSGNGLFEIIKRDSKNFARIFCEKYRKVKKEKKIKK